MKARILMTDVARICTRPSAGGIRAIPALFFVTETDYANLDIVFLYDMTLAKGECSSRLMNSQE